MGPFVSTLICALVCIKCCLAVGIGHRVDGDQLLFVKYMEDDSPVYMRKDREIVFKYYGERVNNLTYVHFDHYDDSTSHAIVLLNGGANQHFKHIEFKFEATNATFLHVHTKFYGFRT